MIQFLAEAKKLFVEFVYFLLAGPFVLAQRFNFYLLFLGLGDDVFEFKLQIINLSLPEVRIYGDLAAGPNKDDTAYVALFERT